jgi:hypothetical protein
VVWIIVVAIGGDDNEIVTLVTNNFDVFCDTNGGLKFTNQTPLGFPSGNSASNVK